jgi:hypothetical protein
MRRRLQFELVRKTAFQLVLKTLILPCSVVLAAYLWAGTPAHTAGEPPHDPAWSDLSDTPEACLTESFAGRPFDAATMPEAFTLASNLSSPEGSAPEIALQSGIPDNDVPKMRILYEKLRNAPVERPPAWAYRALYGMCATSDYDNLDRGDKAACECVRLRCELLEDLQNRPTVESFSILHDSFARFRSAIADMKPEESKTFIEDLLAVVAEIVIRYPAFDQELGLELAPVFDQAVQACRPADPAHQSVKSELERLKREMLELDHGSLNATGHFYLAERLVSEVPETDDILDRIRKLEDKERGGRIKVHLLQGQSVMKDRSVAWTAFKKYSLALFKLYETSAGEPVLEAERARLLRKSAYVLSDGIQFSLRAVRHGQKPEVQLQAARKELGTRVEKYMLELQRNLRFGESICFGDRFAPYSRRGEEQNGPTVLDEEGAKRIHGLLAKANYVLDFPYEYHLKQAGSTVTEPQLAEYKKRSVEPYLLSRNMSPCRQEDW